MCSVCLFVGLFVCLTDLIFLSRDTHQMERENAEEWDKLLVGKLVFCLFLVLFLFVLCDSYLRRRRRREITKERRSAEVSFDTNAQFIMQKDYVTFC